MKDLILSMASFTGYAKMPDEIKTATFGVFIDGWFSSGPVPAESDAIVTGIDREYYPEGEFSMYRAYLFFKKVTAQNAPDWVLTESVPGAFRFSGLVLEVGGGLHGRPLHPGDLPVLKKAISQKMFSSNEELFAYFGVGQLVGLTAALQYRPGWVSNPMYTADPQGRSLVASSANSNEVVPMTTKQCLYGSTQGKDLSSGAGWVLGEGFWSSPNGVLYPVDMNHDTFVAENPEMFSIPQDAIPSVEAALGSGWARVRFNLHGVEIDLDTSGASRSPESRVKAIVEALIDRGNNFTGKTINVGVDERPGFTLSLEQALSGSWDNTIGWASRSNPLLMSKQADKGVPMMTKQCLYGSAKMRLTNLLSGIHGTADIKRQAQELALESASAKEFGTLLQSAGLDWIFPDSAQQSTLWSAVQEWGDLFCSVKPVMMSAPDIGRLVHKSEMGGPDAFASDLDTGPWYIVSSFNPSAILGGPFKGFHAGKGAMHDRLSRLLASSRENQQEDVPGRMAVQKYICGNVMADDARAELLGLGMPAGAITPLLQKADRLKPKVKINPLLSGLYDSIS